MLIIFFFLAVLGSLQVCPHDGKADAVTQVHSQRNHNSRRLRGQGNGALSCSKQCCGSGGSSISSESGSVPDLGFDDHNWRKKYSWKKIILFAIYLSREEFGNQKRTSSNLKNLDCYIFSIFVGSFLPSWIRIQGPHWIRVQSGSGSVKLVQKVGESVQWRWVATLFRTEYSN